MRTNDLVLISAVEALLKAAGLPVFVADAYAAAVDGSLGFLPRRVLIAAEDAARARDLLVDAGLGGELRPVGGGGG